MKRILVIVRESTDRQEIDSQKVEMTQFVTGLGYSENEIEWLATQGASARKANKKYLDMIDGIKSKILSMKLEAAALWHLNRLGRQEKYLSEMKEWFIGNKIQVYVKNPSLTLLNEDKTVNAGVSIAWSVFATMVKLDTDEMFAKMSRGKSHNKEQGKYNGGKVLYGYQIDENGYQVPNAKEQEILIKMFNLYATGEYSFIKLAREIESRGIVNRDGKKFCDGSIAKMLVNEQYKDIVGDEIWDKVVKVRTDNTARKTTKESKHINFATGLLKCPYCGNSYLANCGHYECYRKIYKTKRFDSDCPNSAIIKCDVVDSILWELVEGIHIHYLAHLGSLRALNLNNDKSIIQEKISHLRANLKKTDDKLKKVKDGYYDGDMDEVEYKSRIAKIKADKESINQEIELKENSIKTIDQQLEDIHSLDKHKLFMVNVKTVTSIEDRTEAKRIINQHVKLVTVTKCVISGYKGIRIDITLIEGEVHKYWYYYKGNQGKVMHDYDTVWEYRTMPNSNVKRLVPVFAHFDNPVLGKLNPIDLEDAMR